MFVTLEALAEERRELDAREAAWVRKVGEYDRSGDWHTDKYFSSASALRDRCRLDHGVARGYVDLARKLEALPVVADAFIAGDVSQRHAAIIGRAHTPERAEHISNLETELVDVARTHAPHHLAALVRHVTDALDGDGGAAEDEDQHCRRRLHISTTFAGMVATDALYAPDDGEFLKSAIAAEMERDHQAADPRSLAQRGADAHLNLVRRGQLRDGNDGRAGRRHFSVAVDLDDLPGATAVHLDEIRIDLRRHGHLSAATLERLTCDCDISRVITRGQSEILDVGRSTRIVSSALWKALVVRDGHCQGPHCDRPPSSCEAHHIRHWARGGPTNLDNSSLR